MELQQLRYVVEVADTGSFTRAAKRCFVTQSALSHQIAALERELGERLFARTSRSVRVTEAGEAFLTQARIALAAVASAQEDATAAGGRLVGTLRVGMIPTVAAVDLPALIARFREPHPRVRVELTVGNSDSLIAQVRAGTLDVSFVGLRAETRPAGVGIRQIGQERLVAAVSARHRLAGRSEVSLEDLRHEVFADFPAGTSGRAQADTAFAAAGHDRDVAFEAGTAEILLGLVAEDLAVCLLSPTTVTRAAVRVVQVPISDGPLRTEYVVWDEQAPRALARAFLDEMDTPTD